jgi:putative acyl-CoA dehydrogenase
VRTNPRTLAVMGTHDVVNQAPLRAGINEFSTNIPLVEAVRQYDAEWALDDLTRVGELVGTEEFQQDAERANRFEPQLRTHDRWGNRVDEVDYDPSYHRIIRTAVAEGAHTSAWAEPRAGANVARAATFILFAQIEPGHACPISMTHAAVPTLLMSDDLSREWMPRLLSRDYDGALGPGAAGASAQKPGKTSALFGMAMTEKQGGSDVRANSTRAVDAGDGSFRLTGHKWFCSAPMSDAFFVLAQAAEGLSCFLVPRVLADGIRNPFFIQRLKDKLGNRSNASCEAEFDQTVGFLVGEAGRGVRTIIEMVSRTRLDCVFGTAAGMRQSVAEALWHVRHRRAFGALLMDRPAMTAVVADLALESEAATATAMRLARAHDADANEADVAFQRLATAVSKYWICKRGPEHAYEALECLGGNGFIETFPLARRYREQPVMAVWEGSGNVIALDVLRAIARDPSTLEAFDAEVSLATGANAIFDAHLASTRELARSISAMDAAAAAAQARRLVGALALSLQASLLIRHSPAAVSDAFVAARLGADRGRLYGELPGSLALGEILARH